ncbi:MAG: hypothetical protein ABI333_17410 [bacterium]
MKYLALILCSVMTLGLAGCPYDPLLPEAPFLCGPGGKCPDGYSCYGGTCMDKLPECMNPANPLFLGWPDDSDLEPNDHPDMAVVLPCGDDKVISSPAEYIARCPSRAGYTNGFMNLLTCPSGDRDFYAIFMLPNEVVTFQVLHQFNPSAGIPRNLDAYIWRRDEFYVGPECPAGWQCNVVPMGSSTNDNETLTLSTSTASGNPQGWYYLEVRGATYDDLNYYTVSFTLNASGMANP